MAVRVHFLKKTGTLQWKESEKQEKQHSNVSNEEAAQKMPASQL
jgi:hypothetical protein